MEVKVKEFRVPPSYFCEEKRVWYQLNLKNIFKSKTQVEYIGLNVDI